ncbi:MAG TPA: threonine/serine exporter family protein [Chloroflexia bacterium]|nr:threonine/serine exporter family protein [Chloroflexia bacterium]
MTAVPPRDGPAPPGARGDPPDGPTPKRILALAVQAGEIMLQSGAETARVEETVNIVVHAFGLAQSHCLVTPTGIYVSVDDPRLPAPVTLVHRVRTRATHYYRISAVNDLSRRISQGRVPLAAAQLELDAIEQAADPYPFWLGLSAGAGSAAGVALLLGGGLPEVVPAFVSTILVLLVGAGLYRSNIPAIFGDLFGAALATAIALALVAAGLPIHADLVIAGGIMKLVPGAALLTCVQDGISGNLLSSGARGLETILKGAALASGVGLVLSRAVDLGLHIGLHSPAGAVWQIPIQVAAAFGASACYAVSNQVPRFAILTAGLAGAVGWLTSLIVVNLQDTGLGATFLAAFVVGLLSWGLARWQHAPVTLYVVPGIMPLLPGLAIYNGMLDLAESQNIAGLLGLVHALFLGGALAAGVALSNSLAPALRRRRPPFSP